MRLRIPAPRVRWNFDILGQGLFGLWLGISATFAVWQIGRIVRFQRRLRWVIPAPEWLVQEVCNLSGQLGRPRGRDSHAARPRAADALVSGPGKTDRAGTPGVECRSAGLACHPGTRAGPSAPGRSLGSSARFLRRPDLVVEPGVLAHSREAEHRGRVGV